MITFRRDPTFLDDARIDDSRAMADIHEKSFARPWSTEEIAALMEDHRIVQAIALRRRVGRGDRLLGFVMMRAAGGEAEILTIAVASGARRRGYGRRLMEEAGRRAYRDRAEALFLEVDQSNRGAIALYRSLGYETVAERARYYQGAPGGPGTALVMRLSLR